jgi:hypothetical protein
MKLSTNPPVPGGGRAPATGHGVFGDGQPAVALLAQFGDVLGRELGVARGGVVWGGVDCGVGGCLLTV